MSGVGVEVHLGSEGAGIQSVLEGKGGEQQWGSPSLTASMTWSMSSTWQSKIGVRCGAGESRKNLG